jgi:hypothetical protein
MLCQLGTLTPCSRPLLWVALRAQVGLLAALMHGVVTILPSRLLSPRAALHALTLESCTVLDAVPTHLNLLLETLAQTTTGVGFGGLRGRLDSNLPAHSAIDLTALCKGTVGAARFSPALLQCVAHADSKVRGDRLF